MVRGLSTQFESDLKKGILQPILDRVRQDDTLDLQIRNNYVNIYYRGGNLLKLSLTNNGTYEAEFDANYFMKSPVNTRPQTTTTLTTTAIAAQCVKNFPEHKLAMDLYLSAHAKEEREFQQLIVRENNWGGTANDTDYFICDIEYAGSAHKENTKGFRIDMTGVFWPSTSSDRKKADGHRLALFEVKCGVSALGGDAGLLKHLQDVSAFASDTNRLTAFKNEMIAIYKQKHGLGIIGAKHMLNSFSDQIPEFVIVLINYKKASTKLTAEIDLMEKWLSTQTQNVIDLKFAVSNYMGYGLYRHCIYPLSIFKTMI